jgi:hypothetical protein
MTSATPALVITVVALACGCKRTPRERDVCEAYVEVTERCDPPADPRDRRLEIQRCRVADGTSGPHQRANHRCALEASECSQFAICLDEALAEHEGAPVGAVRAAVDLTVELAAALTTASAGKDSVGQTAAVREQLTIHAASLTRLQELRRDRTVLRAAMRSRRARAAMAGFRRVAPCTPPHDLVADAFANRSQP